MPTLTPHTLDALQLRYMKSDVLENKWIGVYSYYFKFAVLACFLGGFLPGSLVADSQFLSLFSNTVSEYCKKLFNLDLTKGVNVVSSPDALVFFRSTLIFCMIFIALNNFFTKYINFKSKVNYYWADNYNKEPIKCFLLFLFFPVFLFFYFQFLMMDIPIPSRPFSFRSGAIYLQGTRAFLGAAFLFFFQIFCWGYIEYALGSLFRKFFN